MPKPTWTVSALAALAFLFLVIYLTATNEAEQPQPARTATVNGELGQGAYGKNNNLDGVNQYENITNEQTIREDLSPEALKARVDLMTMRRPDLEFDPQKVKEALKQEEIWSISRDFHYDLPLSENEINDGRVFLSTNPLRIESLMVSDELPIYVPHTNSTHNFMVENVSTTDNTVRWHGRLKEPESGTVFISRGTSLTSGYISIDSHVFEFRFFNDKGWIHSSAELSHIYPGDGIKPPETPE